LPCSRQPSSCFSWVGPGLARTTASTSVDDGVERVDDGPAAGGARGDLFGLLRDVVVDDGDTRAADPAADAGDVIGAHGADAEDGNAQF
jgi:hypothetical protein